MGCCGKDSKKIKKSHSNATKQTNKVEKKKKLIANKKIIDEQSHHIPQEIIEQSQLLKTENNIRSEPIQIPVDEILPPAEHRLESPPIVTPDYDIDNISPLKTFNDFQTLVRQNQKPVSIILFYGRYCPYSQRTIPGLRQWAQTNKDRIFLYEVDVEQDLNLAEYYHVRSIPTIMAFDKNNLLAPIWQRTANNVSSNDLQSPIEEPELIPDDLQANEPNRLTKMIDETKQEQYLIVLDEDQSLPNKSKLMLAITNEKGQPEYLETVDQNSITSSQQSSYIWDRSTRYTENESEKSSKELIEYNGRMISQSAISTIDSSKKNQTWIEQLNHPNPSDDYPQHIHLPNCNEISYEKQYEFYPSLSSDRLSTLTYQHVKNTNDRSINPKEEICILYLGPNRCRGFEDNIPYENHSSKLSLLTLKSHSLSE